MTDIAWCDTETIGLHPDLHQIWEVGLIVNDAEYHWFLPVDDLAYAEAKALEINRFYERIAEDRIDPFVFCEQFTRLTAGKHLGGANPAFDADRLGRLLRRHHQCPSWHHRLLDVEAFVAGRMGWAEPRSLTDCCEALGVAIDTEQKHGALHDASLAQQVYLVALTRALDG